MNHPDLHFPSHRPESTAQNKAMGKKLCSSFTLPVFPNSDGRRISKYYVVMQFVQQIRIYVGTISCITSALMILATDTKFITQSNSKTSFHKAQNPSFTKSGHHLISAK